MNSPKLSHIATYWFVVLLVVQVFVGSASAQHLEQFSFLGANGSDPRGGVIVDAAGNFYGSTYLGGAANVGVVYEISATSGGGVTQTVLYSFTGNGSNGDGANPIGDLVFDQSGNLYGVTQNGGNSGSGCSPSLGCGTVFELSPPSLPGGTWTETIIYAFQGSPFDGAQPAAGLVLDSAGNIYGTTQFGGIVSPTCGCGVVFELSPPISQGGVWTETIAYMFQGGFDGSEPLGALVFDQAGNLYSTTSVGGESNDGTVFELTPPAVQGDPWPEALLHSFMRRDGVDPETGLAIASDGTLFGTTRQGGPKGEGVVFALKPPSGSSGWQFAVIYSFVDGGTPRASITLGHNENILYGTSTGGSGRVFQISASGRTVTYTVLYDFHSITPESHLTLYKNALYGTTIDGGSKNKGIAFRLSH